MDDTQQSSSATIRKLAETIKKTNNPQEALKAARQMRELAEFSSDEWLKGEREASQQVADGQTSFYEDEDALERAFAERKQHDGSST